MHDALSLHLARVRRCVRSAGGSVDARGASAVRLQLRAKGSSHPLSTTLHPPPADTELLYFFEGGDPRTDFVSMPDTLYYVAVFLGGEWGIVDFFSWQACASCQRTLPRPIPHVQYLSKTRRRCCRQIWLPPANVAMPITLVSPSLPTTATVAAPGQGDMLLPLRRWDRCFRGARFHSIRGV